jgi:hypothetical protein
MARESLGQRLFEVGRPNPEFALQGTVNWMRALALLTESSEFKTAVIDITRGSSSKRETRRDLQDRAFEKLFLAENYVAAIRHMTTAKNPHDVARVAIVSWYYCVYFSSHAMLAIAAQTVPERHEKTARVWLNQLVTGPSKSTIPHPFNLHVTTLVKATADKECAVLKRGTSWDLNTIPTTLDQAHDAHVSYLKGSSGFYREKAERKLRNDREFLARGYTDFRKKGARELRDQILSKGGIGFLDMAIRYRGKANYRDALFLCYGPSTEIGRFVKNISSVADAYHAMAVAWVSARTPVQDWSDFVRDLGVNSRLTAST